MIAMLNDLMKKQRRCENKRIMKGKRNSKKTFFERQKQKHCNINESVFDGFISRLETAEQIISLLKDGSIETSQTKMQREKQHNNDNNK